MPIISTFFGIVIRMYYDEHGPPHIHVEYQNKKALLDFMGNVIKGEMNSRTALKLVREWIDFHEHELMDNWNFARTGSEIRKIDPLN